jgi:hypothetical protein
MREARRAEFETNGTANQLLMAFRRALRPATDNLPHITRSGEEKECVLGRYVLPDYPIAVPVAVLARRL